MKRLIIFFAWLFCITAVTSFAPPKASAQVSVSFQVFYDDLSPYGTWVNTADYGYAWIPDVADGFIPYNTNGYWIFTDAGWTWVSEYSWGWAPFHYGRWYTDAEYGPMWVPGNEWGPGWVSWRQAEGYYGWAPIGPGISIDIAYGSSYNNNYNQWTFVRNRNFGRSNMNRYYMNRANNFTIFNNSTVINNIQSDRGNNNVRYNGGPTRTDVQRRSGRSFTPIAVKENNTPGQHVSKTEYQVYKPRVQQNNDAGQRPAPAQVKNIQEVRKVKERNAAIPAQRDNQINKKQTTPKEATPPQPNKQPERQQPQQQSQPNKQQRDQQQPAKQPQTQQPVQVPNRQPERQQQTQPNKQQRDQQQPARQPQTQQPVQVPNKQPVRQQPVPPQKQQQPARQQQPQQQPRQQPVMRPERQQQQRQPNTQPVKQQQAPKEKRDNNPHKKDL